MHRARSPERRRSLALLLGAGLSALVPRRSAATAAARQTQVLHPKLAPLPAVALTTMRGESRRLDSELDNAVPLVLNFVFTTCSTSCSLQTAVLAQVQRELGGRGRKLQLASITIDPDNDTPEQLRRFAGSFRTGPGWQFYTGRFDDLLQVQKHFDVYRGSKASHPPVLLMRRSARAPWLRVEGFPDAAELVALIESLPAAG
ncbi:SCO family protein [Piscinibacter sp.]|uniref:SCO family protein n=1 Tax=Piscinibacter sp. TaxID=1903157 RepID=UPI001DD43986|nr:SCO family protein [Piscinibacter sp.]MBK7532417.1 SCO family protein [Piscinibacter sp.]HNW61502.1 SCO family protein [Piscinibacter sp.]HNW61524.1 SCO family protein [Piscinibacter sp.]